MATFGRIEEYSESENWSQYIERLGYYFEANSITEAEKKRSIFLNVCGSKCYGLIRNLFKKAPLMNVTDVGEVINLQDVPSRVANATTVVW